MGCIFQGHRVRCIFGLSWLGRSDGFFFVWITRGLQATIWKNLSWGKQWIKKTLVKLSENMWVKFTKWFSFCVYDDSGSSRSWPATPTLWWWFLCMTRLEQTPYGSSSILVRTYAQILDSVHFNNMKLHFKKVTFLGYRIPSLSHQTPLLSCFFIAW